ncbi:MAG: GDSL-type esterase/lipase family protein [Ruminococcus callidus]
MLGLNELGTGTTESWAQTYAGVISQIRQAQPNAIIYLQSILVVAASQDNPGGAINNATVNARNQALEALANPQDNIYYLNVNEAVMDANGCLDASLTSDGIHLLGNSLSVGGLSETARHCPRRHRHGCNNTDDLHHRSYEHSGCAVM